MKPFICSLALALAVAACSDPPPPTRDEVLTSCGNFNVETCRAFQRCLAWTDTEFWACVNGENSECDDDLQAESCWENQRDALDRCTADIADDSCAELCDDNGFCRSSCLFFCPATSE